MSAPVPFLRLEDLSKRFGATLAVDQVSLALERGEILALLGPSGSGKTTTLRLLAGFEVPDSGRVLVEQDDVTGVAPVARRFGMVFQHYALFPHLDVGQNVAFGLESVGVGGEELSQRVSRALTLVVLAGFERRRAALLEPRLRRFFRERAAPDENDYWGVESYDDFSADYRHIQYSIDRAQERGSLKPWEARRFSRELQQIQYQAERQERRGRFNPQEIEDRLGQLRQEMREARHENRDEGRSGYR